MISPLARLQEIRYFLSGFRFNFSNEDELQQGIAQSLSGSKFDFRREYVLTPKDRFDFFVDGCFVIETKVGGSTADVMRQVSRYAENAAVHGILVVTTRSGHVLPESFNGKPVLVHSLMECAF